MVLAGTTGLCGFRVFPPFAVPACFVLRFTGLRLRLAATPVHRANGCSGVAPYIRVATLARPDPGSGAWLEFTGCPALARHRFLRAMESFALHALCFLCGSGEVMDSMTE